MIKPVGVKLDDELQTRLKALAKRHERSSHWLMKKAITEFIDREEAAEQETAIVIGAVESLSGNRGRHSSRKLL